MSMGHFSCMRHRGVLALTCFAIALADPPECMNRDEAEAQGITDTIWPQCQDLEKQSDQEKCQAQACAEATLENRIVRVSFGTQVNPYLSYSEEDGWQGIVKQVFDQFTEKTRIIPEFVEISQESLDAEVDRDTACVRDVSLNRTDLCVGNAWVTPERIGYAQALPTMWQENFQVVVKQTPWNWSAQIFTAFEPFSPGLWGLIVTMIVLLSLGNCIAEAESNNRDFQEKDYFNATGSGLYYGFKSFFWSEPVTRPVTAEGKILMVGLGFFTLIMLSSYTASLASLMVANSRGGKIQDLDDAIVQRKHICMYRELLTRAKRANPSISWLNVPIDSISEGYEKMTTQACDVMLVDSMFHAVAQASSSDYCDRVLVGSTVMSINCAWFAADEVLSALSWMFADLMSTGEVEKLKQNGQPSSGCTATDDEEDATVGLYVSDVSGVFFIIIVFGLVAGLVHLGKRGFHYSKRKSSTISAFADRVSRSQNEETQAPRDFMANRRSVTEDGGQGMQLVRDYCNEQRMRNTPYERALVVAGARQTESMSQLLKEVDGLTYIYDV